MKRLPHVIFETANFHGGDVAQIEKVIEEFSPLTLRYPSLGIKFHAFRPDNVMLPDFSWYPVIKDFFIAQKEWARLIEVSRIKGFIVWLDLFCEYGVEVLERNLDKVAGLKLQPSVLDNLEVTKALSKLSLDEFDLIINVSGIELSDIRNYVKKFSALSPKRTILQLGFQNHPTDIKDTSLEKVEMLRSSFPGMELSYADHISTETENRFALNFPVYAYLSGCNFIEKHICHRRSTTQYDATAALEVAEAATILEDLQRTTQCLSTGFITANEKSYYLKTLQKPVLAKSLSSGQLVAPVDVMFRRSDKEGLNFQEVKEIQKEFSLLNRSLQAGDTITKRDFRKARIAATVSARVEPSQSPIPEMPFIERCLKIPSVGQVILVTSTPKEDSVLGQYTLEGKVKFWQADPEDVIGSHLGACEQYGIDVILQVIGDCSRVSPEIVDFLLQAHFEAGADFSKPNRFAGGPNCQVCNVQALQQVTQLVGRVENSEDIGLYMAKYPSIFKTNHVDLTELG